MKPTPDTTLAITADYPQFIEVLKARVAAAHLSAARAVSGELILLYWDIGGGIVEKQRLLGWGESVVEMVAADLRRAFPRMTGFSPRNVWDMRRLYEAYSAPEILSQAVREFRQRPADPILRQAVAELDRDGKRPRPIAKSSDMEAAAFLQQLVAEVPWGQNLLILNKLTDPTARLWYLRATARFGWSRNVLLNQLKAQSYERAVTEKKTHNFDLALPGHLAEQADEMLKSTFYLNLLNDKERGADDKPSIGIILCAEKDDVEVEYALRTKANPIGVAAYHLQSKLPGELKGKLPTAEQLAGVVRTEMERGK
jgi:hypothetical protein